MESSNLVASAAIFRSNETISSPNHVPETSRASNVWWSGPTVNGPLDQHFPDDSSYSPEFLAVQNSGHQYHVNDNTTFRSVPDNPILSHSAITDDRMFSYPQDRWYSPPEDNDLTQAYIRSQCGHLWCMPGKLPLSLQAMTSQPLTEPLPIMMPPQEQSTLPKCAWTKDGKRCGHTLLDDARKLGMHLRDSHGIQGNDKNKVRCFWEGCNQELQRGAVVRHIRSCHLKTRWACENCLKDYSRRDAMKKHAKDCQAAEA